MQLFLYSLIELQKSSQTGDFLLHNKYRLFASGVFGSFDFKCHGKN